jgi:XTP/dITP diphosphohydrolase
MKTLIVASHNEGKVREFRELLAPFGFTVRSAAELNLPEPEETGSTFEANAELKANAAAQASGQLSLADDSGLAVPALDGAPGIYSARWAGPAKDFNLAMARVASELHACGIEPTGTPAYFVCVLSLAYPDGSIRSLRGEVHGTLTFPPRGTHGFGYDPIFVPSGHNETFGEMDPSAKNAMSHRARAFAALQDHLREEAAA